MKKLGIIVIVLIIVLGGLVGLAAWLEDNR